APFGPDGASLPSSAEPGDEPAAAFEIVEPHQAGAYGFVVRVQATGRLYRITPTRDPREPRFWCVVVYRCTASGLPDGAERPWIGGAGMRREDLRDAMAAIRGDVGGWLTAAASPEFRTWFLAPAESLPGAGPGHAKTHS
ncbi:MAG TPA: hypothetical protein VFU81_12535, partial [Thermomicrobiales bacterium]|nr:hypothetical protein [Thermomicrobiales bacterium]